MLAALAAATVIGAPQQNAISLASHGDRVTQTKGLFWRALLAFLALPTIVAFFVPWVLLPGKAEFNATASPIVVLGTILLLWCVRDFYVAGHGTLAPWAPPQHLVTVGLYRVSRNPMYVAVVIIVAGWAVAFRSRGLTGYAVAVAIAFHLRVLMYEEPWLGRTFGRDWARIKPGCRAGLGGVFHHQPASIAMRQANER